MLQTFIIKDQQLQITTGQDQEATVFLLSSPTQDEIQSICRQFDLAPVTFARRNSAVEVSRFHTLKSRILTDAQLLVMFDFNFDYRPIDDQLTPAIVIFDHRHLIICTQNSAVSFKSLQAAVSEHDLIAAIVFHPVDFWLDNLNHAMKKFEKEITRLNDAADTTIKNDELHALARLVRKFAYFEHTVNDQTSTINALLASSIAYHINEELRTEIETNQRHLAKAIHIYRDAVEALSSLYTAIMDNRLNHLMKFLDSTGLIIGIAALLSGLMGMNVGGLPWKNSAGGGSLLASPFSFVQSSPSTFTVNPMMNKKAAGLVRTCCFLLLQISSNTVITTMLPVDPPQSDHTWIGAS